MKVAVGMLGMHSLAGDFAGLRDIVALADKKGIDKVTVFEHVVMGQDFSEYPEPPFTGTPDFPFIEPMVELASYAGVTENIRLASSILIGPLRPAAVLAKQIASLDVLSRGRAEIGLGVGWQSAEYRACGVDYARRFDILEDQIRACRLLWTGENVSYAGDFVQLDNVTAMPAPVQGASIPIWLGIAPKPRNVRRMAELAQGWCPMGADLEQLKSGADVIRRAVAEQGRDPDAFGILTTAEAERGADGKTSLDATIARAADYAAAGVTELRFEIRRFCRRMEDVEPFLERIVQVKGI